jgi:hypothetical protein
MHVNIKLIIFAIGISKYRNRKLCPTLTEAEIGTELHF